MIISRPDSARVASWLVTNSSKQLNTLPAFIIKQTRGNGSMKKGDSANQLYSFIQNFKIYSQLLFNQLLTKFSWKSCCIKISLLSFISLLSGEIFEEMKSYDCENPRIFPHRIFRAINLTYYMLIFLCVSIRSNPVN